MNKFQALFFVGATFFVIAVVVDIKSDFIIDFNRFVVLFLSLQKVGCRILKVFSNICPQSSDRVVQCIGKSNECMDAINDILLLIKEVPIKGSVQNYDPINYDDYMADKYGGFGGDGGSGGNRNNGGNRGGVGGGGSGGGQGNHYSSQNSRNYYGINVKIVLICVQVVATIEEIEEDLIAVTTIIATSIEEMVAAVAPVVVTAAAAAATIT